MYFFGTASILAFNRNSLVEINNGSLAEIGKFGKEVLKNQIKDCLFLLNLQREEDKIHR